MKKVLFISHDPGGANAILPVFSCFKDKPGIEAEFCGLGPSRIILHNAGFANIAPPDSDDWRGVEAVLSTFSPCLIVTGTSWGNDCERRSWLWALRRNVPVFAVLDYWSNYLERFQLDGELVLPGWISVMDTTAEKEMAALGFPPGRLFVLGNPYFDRIIRGKDKNINEADILDKREKRFILLYLSQPLSKVGIDYGYDEEVVLKDLCCFMRMLGQDQDSCELRVRPHPKDNVEEIGEILFNHAGDLPVFIDCFEDGYRSISKADAVIGMSSVMLLEAALMGKTTVSYQPGLVETKPDPCMANRLGLSKGIKGYNELKKFLQHLIKYQKNSAKPEELAAKELPATMDGHAAERNVNLILQILNYLNEIVEQKNITG